jgi:hypothetical protein
MSRSVTPANLSACARAPLFGQARPVPCEFRRGRFQLRRWRRLQDRGFPLSAARCHEEFSLAFFQRPHSHGAGPGGSFCRPTARESVRLCGVNRSERANAICVRAALSHSAILAGSRASRRANVIACTRLAKSGPSLGRKCSALAASSMNSVRSDLVSEDGGSGPGRGASIAGKARRLADDLRPRCRIFPR